MCPQTFWQLAFTFLSFGLQYGMHCIENSLSDSSNKEVYEVVSQVGTTLQTVAKFVL
jgi:hypothetical protein